MNKKLRALIDRAERLIAEREAVNDAMKDLRAECKGQQYDAAQIMRLAQLSHDDKKRAKLAESNEILNLYNRESGLGLVLGLDDTTERTPVETPATGREGPADLGNPPRPDPTPPSTTGSTLPPAGNDAHRSSSAATSPVVETPKPGPAERRMIAAIAERGTSPDVAEIALATARMHDQGRVYGAAAIVAVAKAAAAGDDLAPDLARMSESELVERALSHKPAFLRGAV